MVELYYDSTTNIFFTIGTLLQFQYNLSWETKRLKSRRLLSAKRKLEYANKAKVFLNKREVDYFLCTQFSGGSLLLSKGISPHDTLASIG